MNTIRSKKEKQKKELFDVEVEAIAVIKVLKHYMSDLKTWFGLVGEVGADAVAIWLSLNFGFLFVKRRRSNNMPQSREQLSK